MKDLQIFSRRSASRMWFGPAVCFGLVAAGAVGWATEQNALWLNGYIAAVAGYGQLYLYRFNREFNRELTASESAIHSIALKTVREVGAMDVSSRTPIVIRVAKAIASCLGDRQHTREAMLLSIESAMLDHVLFVSRLAKGTLQSLGMAGTLFGLQLAMISIANGMTEVGDVKGMTAAILPAVSSLGLAFTTTLTALLLGSLVLATQANETVAAVEHFFTQLNAQLTDPFFQSPDEVGQQDKPEDDDETTN